MAALSLYRLCNNMIFKTTPAFSPKLIGFLCSTFTSSSETRTDLNKEYDMVIVGGGIVGPALACSIGKLYFTYIFVGHILCVSLLLKW